MKTPVDGLSFKRASSTVTVSCGVMLAGALAGALCLSAQEPDRFQPEIELEAVQAVEAARQLVRQKEMAPAVEKLTGVTEQHPDYYRGAYNLGLALAKSGRPDDALLALDKAADLKEQSNIDDPTLLPSIGWTQYLAGDYLSASRTLEAALEQENLSERSRIKVLNNLGTVYKRLGAFEEARSVLQKSAATGSARAEANLKVIDVTQRMQMEKQRSLPFNLEFKKLHEVERTRSDGESPAGSTSEDGSGS